MKEDRRVRLEGLYKTMLGSTICAGQENELLTGAALRAEIIGKLCQEIALSLSFCFFFFCFLAAIGNLHYLLYLGSILKPWRHITSDMLLI